MKFKPIRLFQLNHGACAPLRHSSNLDGRADVMSRAQQGGFMRNMFGVVTLTAVCLLSAGLLVAADGPPGWAYGFPPGPAGAGSPPPAAAPAAAPDTSLKHLPGSTQ